MQLIDVANSIIKRSRVFVDRLIYSILGNPIMKFCKMFFCVNYSENFFLHQKTFVLARKNVSDPFYCLVHAEMRGK